VAPEEPPPIDSSDSSDDSSDSPDDSPDSSDEAQNPLQFFCDQMEDDQMEDSHAVARGGLTEMQLVVVMLDWMAVYKVADETAKDMWKRVKAIIGDGVDRAKFNSAKRIVMEFHREQVQIVDLCINDCIAFVDCPHIKDFQYMHSHRTKCPRCGEKRYTIVCNNVHYFLVMYIFF
jgi:hypothetical protein